MTSTETSICNEDEMALDALKVVPSKWPWMRVLRLTASGAAWFYFGWSFSRPHRRSHHDRSPTSWEAPSRMVLAAPSSARNLARDGAGYNLNTLS